MGAVAVAAVLGTIAFFGFSPFVHYVQNFGAASTPNSTNATQKQLYINGFNMAAGTSTSVQNNTGVDVVATELQYYCTGLGTSLLAYTGTGIASVTLKAATTSTTRVGNTAASNTAVSNTNTIVSTTIATSSVTTVVASTTPAIAGNVPLNDIIPAGSFITFFTNATNTAVCNIGVQIIGS